MATPAERKALLFFGLIAMLGASVRIWRARQSASRSENVAMSDTTGTETYAHSSSGRSKSPNRARTSVRTSSTRSRTGQTNRDSNSVIDLDRATEGDIDALGVLPKGMARLIVADRDSFGPFGSVVELRRVPFLSASTLRKLAPRVTFSRLPRPRNTVVNPHPLPVVGNGRRKAAVQP
jgi:DNA uptake protein ComE-like DNA-binding protein